MKSSFCCPLIRRTTARIAASVLLLGASTAHAVPTWSPPTQLSSALPLNNLQFDGSIALDPFGNSVAVWNAQNGFIQAASQVVGGPYSAAVDISQNGDSEEAFEPRVTMAPYGAAIAIWTSNTFIRRQPPVYAIKAATKLPNGAWTAPIAITTSTVTASSSPRIALDAFGNALAIWQNCDIATASCVIQAASKSITGAWSTPVNISAAGSNAFSPQLALSPVGIAVAVWQTPMQGGASVIQVASKRPGRAWSASATLSASTGAASEPKVAIDALGRATVVWTQDFGIAAATRATNGAWTAPVALSTSGLPSGAPDVAMDWLGNATAAWIEFDEFNLGMHLVQMATHRPGAAWSAASLVSTNDDDASAARVSMSPGGSFNVVTWIDNGQNIARAATQLGRTAWSGPVTLGNGLYGTSVEVATTFGSKARALWGMRVGSPFQNAWAPAVSSFSP